MMGSGPEEELGRGEFFSLLAKYTFWQTSSLFQMICKLISYTPSGRLRGEVKILFTLKFLVTCLYSIVYTQTKFQNLSVTMNLYT